MLLHANRWIYPQVIVINLHNSVRTSVEAVLEGVSHDRSFSVELLTKTKCAINRKDHPQGHSLLLRSITGAEIRTSPISQLNISDSRTLRKESAARSSQPRASAWVGMGR